MLVDLGRKSSLVKPSFLPDLRAITVLCRPLGWAHISKRGASSSPSWSPSRTHSWLLILQKCLIIWKEWLKIGCEPEDATQGRSLRLNDVHWKEESVYLIRVGEREGGREKEGVSGGEGSGERERQKEGHSLLSGESEREKEEGGGRLKGCQAQSAKVKERHRNRSGQVEEVTMEGKQCAPPIWAKIRQQTTLWALGPSNFYHLSFCFPPQTPTEKCPPCFCLPR